MYGKRRLKLYLHKEHYYPKLVHGTEEDEYELNHLGTSLSNSIQSI